MPTRSPSLTRVIHRLRHGEGGFTLVELGVAMGIVLTALLAVAYTATVGFSDIALARQRQTANALANEGLERVRSLPFNTLKRGLGNAHLAGDPNITTCGFPAVNCFRGERLLHGDNPAVVPLVPHRRTTTVGGTSYQTSVYVTYRDNDTASETYRVTVLVSWANAQRRGVSASVETQSVFHASTSGSGCHSPQTHPFPGPCQPFLYANSAVEAGRVDVTGTISGVPLDRATLWLPYVSENMQIEQVSAVQGIGQTGGLTLKVLNQPDQRIGRDRTSSMADNDPAQPAPVYDTRAIPPPTQAGGTLTASGNGNSLSVSAGTGGDHASTTSTVDAEMTIHPCTDRNGVYRTDRQPCGVSRSRLGFRLSANLRLQATGIDLGASTLASVESPSGSAPGRVAFVNRDLAHEVQEPATECPQASGDGCVHADGYRTTGEVRLGALPSLLDALAPLGWGGHLVRITPSTATGSAEAGMGTSPPSATAVGTISYWNGLSYTDLPILGAGSGSIPVGPVTISGGTLAPDVTVVLSATIQPGTTSLSDPAACATPCTRNVASASSGSPIVDLDYRVLLGGTTLADLDVHADLGTVLAQTSYQPAPNA